MRCDEALELLSAALDGEVTPAQQAKLDQHLAQCPACRAIQAELLGLRNVWEGLEVAAPAELKAAVMEHLPPQKAPAKGLYWRRWSTMAAAVALVALAAWQLPRFVLDPPKSGDTSTQVNMALDVPEDAPLSDSVTNDGPEVADALPPYVEGEGVNVNSYMGSPAPTGDSSMTADEAVYDTFSVPEGTPELPAAKATVQGQAPDPERSALVLTSGAVDPSVADAGAAPAGGGSSVAMSKKSAESGVEDLVAPRSAPPAPEPVPEAATYSGAVSYAGEIGGAMDSLPEIAVANEADAPTEMPSPFVSYCGVLTLAEYAPSDQAYTVEFSEGGLVHYLLPAQDFFALVDQLIDQDFLFELRAQGEDIDPDATCGLVVVTGAEPEQAP